MSDGPCSIEIKSIVSKFPIHKSIPIVDEPKENISIPQL